MGNQSKGREEEDDEKVGLWGFHPPGMIDRSSAQFAQQMGFCDVGIIHYRLLDGRW